MVRNYKRKSDRATAYSPDDLKIALASIKRGEMDVKAASSTYHIPKTTLWDHIKGRRGQLSTSQGRPIAIPLEQEKQLANCLTTMEKWGLGLTVLETRIAVKEWVEGNSRETVFTDNMPGKTWVQNFKARHELSLKKPQSVEFARKKAIDPFVVKKFFSLLESTLGELGLEGKPQYIFNVDETSFCMDPSKSKILGKKGLPSTRTTSGPGRTNVTVCFCGNAAGQKLPPLFIFKGKNLWDQWMLGDVFPGSTFAASTNGWMVIFLNWFRNCFLKNIGQDRPVLLIYDGHSTHITIPLIQLAMDNQIVLLKLPPHTSHILQPLDLSVFKPLKSLWDKELVSWQRKNIGKHLPKKMLASIIGRIWSSLNPEILKNGFGKAGVYPFNSGVVDESSYDQEALKRWKHIQAPHAAENPPANVPSTSSESQAQVPVATPSLTSSAVSPSGMPSTPDADTSFEEKILSFLRGGQQTSTAQKRKRVGTGSEVLTTEDVVARLENEKVHKEKSKKKGPQKSKKKGPQKSKKKSPPKRTKKRAAKKNVTPETSDDEDFIASTRTARRRAAKKNRNPLETTDEDEDEVPPAVEVIALEPMEDDGHQESVSLTLALDEGVPSSSRVRMVLPKVEPSPFNGPLPEPSSDWDLDSGDDDDGVETDVDKFLAYLKDCGVEGLPK